MTDHKPPRTARTMALEDLPSVNTSPLTKPTALPTGLEKLPGIGEATAKKIIAGRPYQTVGDLAKAGPQDTLEKITPMVTVGSAAPAAAEAAPAPAAPAETKKVEPAKAAKAAPRARTETVTARAPGHVR